MTLDKVRTHLVPHILLLRSFTPVVFVSQADVHLKENFISHPSLKKKAETLKPAASLRGERPRKWWTAAGFDIDLSRKLLLKHRTPYWWRRERAARSLSCFISSVCTTSTQQTHTPCNTSQSNPTAQCVCKHQHSLDYSTAHTDSSLFSSVLLQVLFTWSMSHEIFMIEHEMKQGLDCKSETWMKTPQQSRWHY